MRDERGAARAGRGRAARRARRATTSSVYYQPIVALPSGASVAARRWCAGTTPSAACCSRTSSSRSPRRRGSSSRSAPGCCARRAARQRSGGARAPDVGVTVNVSPLQLAQDDFVELVRETLRDSRAAAAALCASRSPRPRSWSIRSGSSPASQALHALGVRIAHGRLRQRLLVAHLPESCCRSTSSRSTSRSSGNILDSAEDRAIVSAYAQPRRRDRPLGDRRGRRDRGAARRARGLGCELAQGFLYDEPKPPVELRLDGYSSRVHPGVGDPLVIREFMRQIGIPARIGL